MVRLIPPCDLLSGANSGANSPQHFVCELRGFLIITAEQVGIGIERDRRPCMAHAR